MKIESSKKDLRLLKELNEKLLLLLSPMVPFITEELWEMAGNQSSIHRTAWPSYDEEIAAEDMATIVFQVNGKLRDRASVPVGTPKKTWRQMALASEKIRNFTAERDIVKIIVVSDKLVNIVIK